MKEMIDFKAGWDACLRENYSDMANTITELQARIAQLESERDFAIEYLNPADTSFRQMIDTFRTLSKDQQDKLIELSRALKALGPSHEL